MTKRKPMTVRELRELLAARPDDCFVAWCDERGTVGYFYAEDQANSLPDDGHVHLELGDCEP